MNLNATLLVQILCFIVFIWVSVRFIWPPMMKALEDRRQNIADGLAAGEQGRKDLELAEVKAREMHLAAKAKSAQMVDQAMQRANSIVEEAKSKARTEGDRLLEIAQGEIQQQYTAAKQTLLQEVTQIAVAGAERILQKEVDKASNDRLINDLVSEIQ
jgi:F-type H+-transporting ATPase subunit b